MNDIEKKQLVLVVDDHPKVLRFIEIDLKLRGFEVLTTTSGAEALEMVRLDKPDIILLDIRKLALFADYFVVCSGTSERQLKAILAASTALSHSTWKPEK